MHVIIQIGYLQPLGLVILGFSIWLLLRFGLFEPRTDSKLVVKIGLAFLLPFTAIIASNFLIGVILNVIHSDYSSFLLNLSISIGSLAYLIITVRYKPFKALNSWFISKKESFGGGEGHHFLKRHPLTISLLCWLIISPILIFVPYSIYHQEPPVVTGGRRVGFWTSSFYYDVDNPDHLPNQTLELLANESVYVVISIKETSIGVELVERLNRCKEFGLEVHLSISVNTTSSYKYVNIWNIEELMPQIDNILTFLNTSNLLEDPVTTLTYDMEVPGPEFIYPIYTDSTIREKLGDYYAIQGMFDAFNQHIRDDFNLSVRICTDYFQVFDRKDGDDDLTAMRGLLEDEGATMSYMAYRRDNLGQNHILDHCRYLDDGETIILNAWKFEGYHCWEDLDCAVEDARLVLGYPGKTVHLEIWTLYYFLKSYNLSEFHDFINAISGDWTVWPSIEVENAFPYSSFWDLVLIGVSLLDLYGPIFRIMNNAV